MNYRSINDTVQRTMSERSEILYAVITSIQIHTHEPNGGDA